MSIPLTERSAVEKIVQTTPAFQWPEWFRPETARRINFRLKKNGRRIPLYFLGIKELKPGAPSGQVAVLSVDPPTESTSAPVKKHNKRLLITCSYCVILAPIRSGYRLENWKVRGGKTTVAIRKRVATVAIVPINGVERFRSVPH